MRCFKKRAKLNLKVIRKSTVYMFIVRCSFLRIPYWSLFSILLAGYLLVRIVMSSTKLSFIGVLTPTLLRIRDQLPLIYWISISRPARWSQTIEHVVFAVLVIIAFTITSSLATETRFSTPSTFFFF